MSLPNRSEDDDRPGRVAQLALQLTAWTERWIPDAFIFALLGTVSSAAPPCS